MEDIDLSGDDHLLTADDGDKHDDPEGDSTLPADVDLELEDDDDDGV